MIRLLILDDDPNYCELLSDSLEEEKLAVEIETANSLSQAIQFVEQAPESFDVFLIDFLLRGQGQADVVDGLQAVETLRCLAPEAEVIVLTGLNDRSVHTSAYQAGASRTLVKPFDLSELMLMLESIDAMKILNTIARQTQGALTPKEVADILVRESVSLGFERGRFYLVDKEAGMLRGVSQMGLDSLGNFSEVAFSIQRSPYARSTSSTGETRFFNGLDLGDNVLAQDYDEHAFPRPIGEWVDVALRNGDECIGILALDNHTVARTYHPEQRRILRLLAHQAAAALRRALQLKETQRTAKINQMAHEIMQKSTPDARSMGLQKLLDILYEQIQEIVPNKNFVVVMRRIAEEPGQKEWLYFCQQIQDGETNYPSWRSPQDYGLTNHLIDGKQALHFGESTLSYRAKHAIRPPLHRVAQSWMGIPILVGEETAGAIIIEDYEVRHAWTQEQFKTCRALTERLATFIHASWLNQQREELLAQLEILHQASETIVNLVDNAQGPDAMWHATLTLATAGYGLRFNRAVLFLVEPTTRRLVGHMGIGHFDKKSWERDVTETVPFHTYLERIEQFKETDIQKTPVGRFVHKWEVPCDQPNCALREVLEGRGFRKLSQEEAASKLPTEFIEKFGIHETSVVPVTAANRVIGLVILDTAHTNAPHTREALVYFDTLTNEAALIYEAWRNRQQLTQLLSINRKILGNTITRRLHETLYDLCRLMRKTYMHGASIVAIYPFNDRGVGPHYDYRLEYDLENAQYSSDLGENLLTSNSQPSTFVHHVLQTGVVEIQDIDRDQTQHGGIRGGEHPFVQRMGIKSLLAVPILDPISQKTRGIMFVNHLTPHIFSKQEFQLAEAFANLAGVAIRQAQSVAGIEGDKRAREEELVVLGNVLQKLYVSSANESQIATMILRQMRSLLKNETFHCTISFVEWNAINKVSEPAQPIRRCYAMDLQGKIQYVRMDGEIYQGISGKALQEKRTQFVKDVHASEWAARFYDRGIGTCTEINVPIETQNSRIVGVLSVESPQYEELIDSHRVMLERFASAIGLAYEGIKRAQDLRTILDAAAAMTAPYTLDETLDAVLLASRKTSPSLSAVTIWYRSPESGKLKLGRQFGLRNQEVLSHGGFTPDEYFTERTRPDFAENVRENAHFAQNQIILKEQIRSSAALPLWAQDQSVGVMFFHYREPRQFTPEDRTFIRIFAEIAAAAINDSRLLDQADKERKRHTTDLFIADIVGSDLAPNEAINRILGQASMLYPDTAVCVVLYDKYDRKFEFMPGSRSFYPVTNSQFNFADTIPLEINSIAGALAIESVIQKRKLMSNVGNVSCGPLQYQEGIDAPLHSFSEGIQPQYLPLRLNTRSQLTITLYSQEFGLVGVLILETERENAFDGDDERTLWGIAKHIRLVLERDQLNAQVRFKDAVAGATSWAADIAHDINKQTGHIRNRTYWLRNEETLSQDGERYVNEIEQAASDLSDVVRASTLQHDDKREKVELEPFLRDCIGKTVNRRGAKTKLFFDFHHQSYPVRINRNSLQRAIHNIVRNSLEAMQWKADQSLSVQTTVIEEKWIEILLQDDGPGIRDPQVQQSLFDKPVSDKGKDHGYGLLFARDAIERMDGTVRLMRQLPDRGARIAIRLPICNAIDGGMSNGQADQQGG